MTAQQKLTKVQRDLLIEVRKYGMRRRTGWGPAQHWVHTTGQRAHPRSVSALFDARFLRVASLGVEDIIEISDAGRAYLEEHSA